MDLKKKKINEALEELTAKKSKPKSKKPTPIVLPSIQTLKKTYQKFSYRSLFDVTTTNGKAFLIIVSICLSIVVHQTINNISLDIFSSIKDLNDLTNLIPQRSIVPIKQKPIYWFWSEDSDKSNIETDYVHRVLKRLGMERGDNHTDWDLLWSHDSIVDTMPTLKSHQKINHYPSGSYLTNKASLLSTENLYNFVLKLFTLPNEQVSLLEYARQNPDALYVQKTKEDPEVVVKTYEDLDLDAEESTVQIFTDNPLLIDGHKFDIGIYVLVTSVNPLRAYMYKGDVMIKFCAEKFFPFNAIISDKYVATKSFLPTWKLPTFSKYNQLLGFGKRDSLNAYINAKESSSNIDLLWNGIEDAIRIVLLEREQYLIDTALSSSENFFQILRFDTVVDEKYNPYILEAIMSPSPESEEEELFYEQMLYNFLNLVGVGTTIERDSFKNKTQGEEHMISADKNIAVNPNICANEPCSESCTSSECHLCLKCLSPENAAILHAAYREHMFLGESRRIFPFLTNELDEEWLDVLSTKNQFLTRWYYGKCFQDPTWCGF